MCHPALFSSDLDVSDFVGEANVMLGLRHPVSRAHESLNSLPLSQHLQMSSSTFVNIRWTALQVKVTYNFLETCATGRWSAW